ncbi:MAG TPA: glucans biosynthesis glucosyltransferase MdoH [Opitutaceae bacterium]|nr:glucans biosynthesis glucosyltransferase MdoH [Opitutaceae bacterium]
MRVTSFHPHALDPRTVTRRRTRIATIVLLLTLPAALTMADLHSRTGFDVWKAAHLFLFTILFAQLAFGVAQAWVGYRIRRRGGDPFRIIRSVEAGDATVLPAPTAVIMPICNEDVGRVMEGMRAIYESVRANGQLADCDFFLLSDSPDPNNWVKEEAAWLALVQKLGAHGRIFYRKRRVGINKKAGNVADFCRRWGGHYRYMVVLDADSIISGEAVATLVCLMERNPKVGLIQAVPVLVNGETILARVQQFASRLYGTFFSAGLNYWQLGEANYWGHNAIIRVQPFIQHCSLPELPGRGPFGGRILSHDYVEAALMRRAGWQVWLATDLPGNYEECPANLIDFAKRDRRWLQGNLQHARLIVARGFHAVNRLHFFLGILSYVASPLWFALLMLSCVIAWKANALGASAPPAARGLPWSFGGQALALFGATLVLLLLPKFLALLDLRQRPTEARAFGGWGKIALSIATETFVFTLVAPILMLFHTKFVILTLCRRTVSWGAQRRGAAGDSALAEAFSAHLGQTIFGAALAVFIARLSPALAWWMSPMLAGMILSIPISYVTGSVALGAKLRASGIFVTPEESTPSPELRRLTEVLATRTPGRAPLPELADDYGLLQAVIDPYVNAAHVSLLRSKDNAPSATEQRLGGLREKLLREGPGALPARDRLALLSDVDSMVALHEDIWAAPPGRLAAWWRLALEHYQVVAAAPQTAFLKAAGNVAVRV